MSTYRLDKLFTPSSLALVGGSDRPGSLGAAVLRNIRAAAFGGSFGIVNPKHREIGGEKTAATIVKLPFVPELIVITAPPSAVPGIVEEAGRIGVSAAVILSAGMGHGAASFAAAALDQARRYGLRLIGPNCIGVMSPGSKLNASFAAHNPQAGSLALISQSGAVAAAMVEWAVPRHIGFSAIVSIGDQLDTDIADCLDHFAGDAHTRAILLYVESIPDARKFMSAARAAARVKPVVVVKAGRMAQGAKAASTHTGALAGSDAVYDAAFRRVGLLRVFDLKELFTCAEVLASTSAPRGRRLAILTNGGGIGILAVDRLVELGGIPSDLGTDLGARLDAALPAGWSHANPVDIAGDADAARYRDAIRPLLEDDGFDAVLVMNVQTAVADPLAIAAAVVDEVTRHRLHAGNHAKTVLATFVGAASESAECLEAAGIPNFQTEDDAVRAFMYGVHHTEAIRSLLSTPPAPAILSAANRSVARSVVDKAMQERRTWLGPLEIASLFAAYGIPMVPTLGAATSDEAVAHAERFFAEGNGVALKILSRDITHKSDVGGVVLGLKDADAVRQAFAAMMKAVREKCPEARIDGVIVQPMIDAPHDRELILGIASDPTFGPVIVFGRGGIAVEVVNDKALALPPLDGRLADDLVRRTAVSRLLDAYRDVPAARRDLINLALVGLSQMAADIAEIRELDVNPLIADADRVLALDARVALQVPQRVFAGGTRLAIRPYPAALEEGIVLPDGWKVSIRPIRPDDESAVQSLLRRTDRADIRFRFLGAIKEFSHSFVARLTQIDYARAMAFAAIDPGTGDILGVVRMHSDSIYETAEYAILVRSDQKGRGLGWALMTKLIGYAASERLVELKGTVLRSNEPMLAMCRTLGFSVTNDPQEPDVMLVTLKLPCPEARQRAEA